MGRREAEVLAAFLGGMALGAAVAVLLRPRSRGGSLHGGAEAVAGAVVVPPLPGPPRVPLPVGNASRGGWLERRGGDVVTDLSGLRARLAGDHPAHPVDLGLLSPGIVEVVGVVDGPETARSILGAVAAEPGVRTVVNRLWVQGDTL
jgi:hypothetical protein